MKKITTVFLIFLGFLSFVFTNLNVAAEEGMETEYKQMVNYISNHLSEFRTEYNKTHAMESLNATSVEKHCLVYIIDSNEYGIYLDFNDDKGYLVTSFNYSLYTLNTTDDLTYLKDVEFTYYSAYDGFLYYDGESFHKYDEEMDSDTEILYGGDGQGGDGETDIYDIDEYVSSRYPSYKLEETHEKAVEDVSYSGFSMKQLTYYQKYVSKDGGYTYSKSVTEENCALTAAFNVMSNWVQMRIYGHLPPKTSTRNLKLYLDEIPDYIYYGMGEETVGHDFYWTMIDSTFITKMPELYYQMRDYAVRHARYTPELGLSTSNTIETMNAMLDRYGYQNITFTSSFNFSDVMTSLQKGRAVFMGLANSLSYASNHAVALLGYKKYSYKTGTWIFEKTHYAYFFLIDDGYGLMETYFDPNCNSKLVHEFIY